MTTDIEFAAKACGANWKGDGQMITDERITELWNLASNTATSKPDWTYSEIIFATVRAVIAEHDVELRKQDPVPKGFIVVSKDLLAEAIACNTDASLAEARHIINSVLKVSDDEIFREVLKEQTK